MRMRALGVVAIAAALVVGLASPAAAQTKTFKDKSGDVTLVTWKSDGTFKQQQTDTSGLSDITKMKVAYTKTAVTFTATYAKKSKKKNVNSISIDLSVVGADPVNYYVTWSADKAFRSMNGVSDVSGKVIAPVTVKRTAEDVTVTFDPAAIGSPKALNYSFTSYFGSRGTKFFDRMDAYPKVVWDAAEGSFTISYKKIKKG